VTNIVITFKTCFWKKRNWNAFSSMFMTLTFPEKDTDMPCDENDRA